MTGSSSKLLQIQGKRYQERKQNKIPKPEAKKKHTILHPLYCYIMDISSIVIVIVNVNVIVTIVVIFSKAPQITDDLGRHQLAKT